jgi:hypothetical protein
MTSSGVLIYAYKNESGNLMIFTSGVSRMSEKSYCRCRCPVFILQEGGPVKRTNVKVHRLSMMSISPIRDTNQWMMWEVNHVDGNINNNDYSNLRWVLSITNKENYTRSKKWRTKKRRKNRSIG